MKNNYNYNRFAIVIGAKSTPGSVSRNFFRRRFYEICDEYIMNKPGNDFVFLIKKGVFLDKNNEASISNFLQNIKYLINKVN